MQLWRKKASILISAFLILSQIIAAKTFLNGDISSRRIRSEDLKYTIAGVKKSYTDILDFIALSGTCKKVFQMPINSANYDFVGSISNGIYIGSSIYRELYGCQDINGVYMIDDVLILNYVKSGSKQEFMKLICSKSIEFVIVSKNLLEMSFKNKHIRSYFENPSIQATPDEQSNFINAITGFAIYENEDYVLIDACKIKRN